MTTESYLTTSRRSFLKIAFVGIGTALGSLLLKGDTLIYPEIPWSSLNFKSELEGTNINISWPLFLDTIEYNNLSHKNSRNFDITITSKDLHDFPRYFDPNPQHISTSVSTNGFGKIEIAGGVIVRQVKDLSQRYPSNKNVEADDMSKLLSLSIFHGYLQLGVLRNLLDQNVLVDKPLKYYNALSNKMLEPFINATVF